MISVTIADVRLKYSIITFLGFDSLNILRKNKYDVITANLVFFLFLGSAVIKFGSNSFN